MNPKWLAAFYIDAPEPDVAGSCHTCGQNGLSKDIFVIYRRRVRSILNLLPAKHLLSAALWHLPHISRGSRNIFLQKCAADIQGIAMSSLMWLAWLQAPPKQSAWNMAICDPIWDRSFFRTVCIYFGLHFPGGAPSKDGTSLFRIDKKIFIRLRDSRFLRDLVTISSEAGIERTRLPMNLLFIENRVASSLNYALRSRRDSKQRRETRKVLGKLSDIANYRNVRQSYQTLIILSWRSRTAT